MLQSRYSAHNCLLCKQGSCIGYFRKMFKRIRYYVHVYSINQTHLNHFRKTKTTEEKVIEPFYYILEKQTPRPYSGVYNHIFLENQYILNYNHLHFNGTLKQMVQDSTAITTAEENSDIHPNYYDTMHCKLHQYDRVSRGKVKVYCVQGLYETVMWSRHRSFQFYRVVKFKTAKMICWFYSV